MAYKGFAGSGTVGHFLTTTDLQTRFPADLYAGRMATVEIVAGSVTHYFSDGLTWKSHPLTAVDSNNIPVGLNFGGETFALQSIRQTSGTMTYTGTIVAAGGFVEVPGSGIVVPAGWLKDGDGLTCTLHYEFGGTTATNRALTIGFQPVADVGTGTNLQNIGSITDATATPKDGSAIWPVTMVGGTMKRAAIGSSTGVGINTTTFPAVTYNSAVDYRFFGRVSELATASNSITVYRLTLARTRV